MSRRKFDWEKIKTEYVTSDINLRDLAKKNGVSMNTISKYCKKEGWVKAREDYCAKVSKKAVQKSCDKRANELSKVLDSSMLIRDRIYEAMNDPQQFNRYLVTRGRKGGEFETVEEVHEKVDTKAIREMTQALKAVEDLIRSLNNIPTRAEEQRLKLERERFELEKEKWEREKAEQSAAHEVRITFDTDELEGWTE